MTNEEFEAKVRAMLDDINCNQADTVLGMMQPHFVACDAQAQTLTLAFPAQRWERNPIGVMQGGVVATALDYAVACLALCYAAADPVTVSLQVSYLRGAPIDGELQVRVRATKIGRTMIHAFAEAYEAQTPDKLVATANVAYMVP